MDGDRLDPDTLLQTHAEVAIALAGFASVIAALRRPLSELARQRFLSLLSLSLIQVLGCLLPLWSLRFIESPEVVWRLLSTGLLILNLARYWWLVALPARELGAKTLIVLNLFASRVIYITAVLAQLCLLLNAIGIPFRPNFELYYAALLALLVIGFAIFADVATSET